MRKDLPVHAVKASLMRLKKRVDSLLEHWQEAAPVREDFKPGWTGVGDYRIGEFEIIDDDLREAQVEPKADL